VNAGSSRSFAGNVGTWKEVRKFGSSPSAPTTSSETSPAPRSSGLRLFPTRPSTNTVGVMFALSLALVFAATLAQSCAAWQPVVRQHSAATRPAAFASNSVGGTGPSLRLGSAICRTSMVATGSSSDAPAGKVQSYMKKIPPHLQGLALRNQKQESKDYASTTLQGEKSEADKLAAIQAELDGDEVEDELDQVDYAMMMIDQLDKNDGAPEMRTFDLNVEDAEVLRTLRDKMHNEDFKRVFGRGVGELL